MGFKEAINQYGKQLTASFSCGGITYADSSIATMIPHYDGKLFSTVMRCLDIQLDGVTTLYSGTETVVGVAVAGVSVVGVAGDSGDADRLTSVKFGVKAPDDSDYSYKAYGTYIIKEQKYDDDSKTLNLECYDLMLQSMITYDLALDYANANAPITVKVLLDAICSRLGWVVGYTTFTNSDVVIEEEKFDNSYTFRDVLDQIAQVAAGVIAFKDDKLCVLYPTGTGEVVDASNLRKLSIGEKFGPVNSVVIARTPQEDNIYAQNAGSVIANGLTEIKIENNQIMDSHREDFIDAILERLDGMQFWLYNLESFGIGYLDLCDVFSIETLDGTQYETIVLSDELRISQSLDENVRLEAPEATVTDYRSASTTDRVINQTILKVDKQTQEITALITKTEAMANGLADVTRKTEFMMDSDSVDIKISQAVSGINSVTTATGYTFDEEGLKISKDGESMANLLDNTGMSVTRDGEEILTANHEGVAAINLTSRQFLIVGDNSRFENYNDGTGSQRTACFYIGRG